jgi:uncharacterized protein YlzI (FlbEa/FlbD family)
MSSFITATDYNDCAVSIHIDSITSVGEQPRGQTMIALNDRTSVQVKESVQEVMTRIKEAAERAP